MSRDLEKVFQSTVSKIEPVVSQTLDDEVCKNTAKQLLIAARLSKAAPRLGNRTFVF